MVPEFTHLSDKIAVLSDCEMPMILRPRGDFYEVIRKCFAEGLMKGKVAKGVEQRHFMSRKFASADDVGVIM